MTQTEKNHFVKYARGLPDKELEKMYYSLSYDCLGSVAEEMYERGYDMADVLEQEKYERDLGVKAGILEGLCAERGIQLWEGEENNG